MNPYVNLTYLTHSPSIILTTPCHTSSSALWPLVFIKLALPYILVPVSLLIHIDPHPYLSLLCVFFPPLPCVLFPPPTAACSLPILLTVPLLISVNLASPYPTVMFTLFLVSLPYAAPSLNIRPYLLIFTSTLPSSHLCFTCPHLCQPYFSISLCHHPSAKPCSPYSLSVFPLPPLPSTSDPALILIFTNTPPSSHLSPPPSEGSSPWTCKTWLVRTK